jgi:hypothetical protein
MPGPDTPNVPRESSRRTGLIGVAAGAASLVLVLIVALLAAGSTGDQARVSSRPIDPNTLLDLLLAVMVVYSVVVFVLLIVGLVRGGRGGGGSAPPPRWASMILGMFLMGGVIWLAFSRRSGDRSVVLEPIDIVFDAPETTEALPVEQVSTSSWVWFVAIGLALVAAGIAWWTLRGTNRGAPGVLDPDDELRQHQHSLADLLDTAIDDLRRHPDPREAVIATFARLELGLESVGVRRQVADTPLRFVQRVLEQVEVSASAVERLTEAYEEAHYSAHEITRDTQLAAVDALVQVRNELRHMSRRATRAALHGSPDHSDAAHGADR